MKQKTQTMILGNNAKQAEKELKDLGVNFDSEYLKVDKEVALHTHLYILVSKVHNAKAKSYRTVAKPHYIGNQRNYISQIQQGGLKGYDNIILVHNPNKQEDNGK